MSIETDIGEPDIEVQVLAAALANHGGQPPGVPAAGLPSPILADLTGMHRHTAIRWVTYVRRDWAEYLAARAEEQGRDGHE
ncbi:hypothetical protein VM95_11605 [Streptomyces rubellomurinus]|uniref:Uncharacterized protein n=1 Tax=Streptomyces rubellomurinus (strain ATCC 31215) TaxID=359131 RepID=A0A0F2TFK0_STRR3|nr:hypothetical protein VM95_11605 [Streptomyces rubellomurinus]